MTVGYDATSTFISFGGGSPVTWTHTPVSGSPTAVAVLLFNYIPNGSITGVSYGGTNLVKYLDFTANSGNYETQIWGLTNLVGLGLTGPQTVSVSGSIASFRAGGASVTVTGSS